MDMAKHCEFLQAQLTIGRWYLERAWDSRVDVRRRYLSFARETCDIIERLVPTLNLEPGDRKEIGRELALLRARLEQIAGECESERVRRSR